MTCRIGIASTDGLIVNQHFGRTESFLIVDVDEEETIRVREQRFVRPVCEGGNHDENRLEENVRQYIACFGMQQYRKCCRDR